MTDKQIINDLHCCIDDERRCFECSQPDWMGCRDELMRNAFDFINRQKAEIERLSNYNTNLQTANTDLSNGILEAKSEAIKEFADKMTTYIERIPRNDFCLLEVEGIIDKILKEMTEGENNDNTM